MLLGLQSGTEQDGVFQRIFVLNKYNHSGVYQLQKVRASDLYGNWKEYESDELEQAGVSLAFTVTVTNTNQSPTLSSIGNKAVAEGLALK